MRTKKNGMEVTIIKESDELLYSSVLESSYKNNYIFLMNKKSGAII